MSVIDSDTQATWGRQAGVGRAGPRGMGVTVGVDTHQRTHHAVVLDAAGMLRGDREFAACARGYEELVTWALALAGSGLIEAVGVESTGSYGAGLTRHLLVAGLSVIEVARPEKSTRARHGKSDPIDAESAARQVQAGTATGRPKISTGIVEAIRILKMPRDGAVHDRTRAYNQLRDLVTTAPASIHDELIGLSGPQRVARALAWRPDRDRLADPTQAAKRALRWLAHRIRELDTQIAQADVELDTLTAQAVPTLRAMPQVGPQTAAQLVITAGQNLDRLRTEASFAKLTGTAPLPATSGKRQHRHRLNRGGDRAANSSLHMIAIGRLRRDPETRAYRDRRQAEGLSTPEILRCLKRHLARHVYRALRTDLMTA
jgi:transposase